MKKILFIALVSAAFSFQVIVGVSSTGIFVIENHQKATQTAIDSALGRAE